MAASTRRRCTGSQMLLTATVPSQSDPHHIYGATCPTCGRTFLLPQHSLPIHYVCLHQDVARPTLANRNYVCNDCHRVICEAFDHDIQALLNAEAERLANDDTQVAPERMIRPAFTTGATSYAQLRPGTLVADEFGEVYGTVLGPYVSVMFPNTDAATLQVLVSVDPQHRIYGHLPEVVISGRFLRPLVHGPSAELPADLLPPQPRDYAALRSDHLNGVHVVVRVDCYLCQVDRPADVWEHLSLNLAPYVCQECCGDTRHWPITATGRCTPMGHYLAPGPRSSCDLCGSAVGPFRETAHAATICVDVQGCEAARPIMSGQAAAHFPGTGVTEHRVGQPPVQLQPTRFCVGCSALLSSTEFRTCTACKGRRRPVEPAIRGCAHPIRQGLSFASSWAEISTGFCPEPAMAGADYCLIHQSEAN